MKFKNKKTNEIVETKGYVQEFAYSHNSEWEKLKETSKPKEPTIAEIKSKLDELGIEYDPKAKKEDLIALLPQE
ncbi:MAG TPA: HeH/LEM domain-containing protein [Clostridiaceae bacterium]|nr:HeH/LEM domain-containing protein [Clostridiaceae bacterium]